MYLRESCRQRWPALKRELIRIAPFLLITIWLLRGDPNLPVVWGALGIVALIVMASHLARKAILPYLDLERFVAKAAEHPIGAALVVVGVLYMLSIIIQSVVALLR